MLAFVYGLLQEEDKHAGRVNLGKEHACYVTVYAKTGQQQKHKGKPYQKGAYVDEKDTGGFTETVQNTGEGGAEV